MRWQRWLILAAVPLLMLAGMALLMQASRKEEIPQQIGPAAPAAARSEPVLARQLDVPGVSAPEFLDPDDARLAPADPVIGVIVAGEPRAYLRRALSGVAKKHLVSNQTEAGRITVTHCDLSNCTRVFVEQADDLKEIRVGGLQSNSTLELLIDGRRYPQRDPQIPLAEFPFAETSWEKWLADHPETKVYVGN